MAEYIEREAVKKSICRYCRDIAPENCNHKNECNVVCRIDSIPAADVRPVVRGRWITRPYMMGNTQYCSRCGENYGRQYNFCPNCGADMREES